ncbi:MAG: amidase, partial [Rhodoferax sp.]
MTTSVSSSSALHDLGVHDLAHAVAAKHVSAVELAQHFLDRAAAHTDLGAFVAMDADTTLAQARAADARIAQGTAGTLEGVPIAHKDIFVTKDFVTTAGSRMLQHYQSPFDATVVAKLAQAGVVTLGKLNCDEFAMGSANENSAYGNVQNPWDTTRTPGGS